MINPVSIQGVQQIDIVVGYVSIIEQKSNKFIFHYVFEDTLLKMDQLG